MRRDRGGCATCWWSAQFAVSIGLIICTAVIYAQTVYARTADAGYQRDGLLQVGNLGFQGVDERDAQVVEQIRRIPGVRRGGADPDRGRPGGNSVNAGASCRASREPVDLGQYAVETGLLPQRWA